MSIFTVPREAGPAAGPEADQSTAGALQENIWKLGIIFFITHCTFNRFHLGLFSVVMNFTLYVVLCLNSIQT